jgi:hypothetical protein
MRDSSANSKHEQTHAREQREKDEIMLLCQELDSLGGGLKTRLEGINVLGLNNVDKGFISSKIMKYLEMYYNCTVLTFGMQNTGKS